ncbi:TrbC/VirB2 family protein [Wolbachia endosymbiont (group E) of Neria commutata]|uniref:TrbC/VirB2 family protein n=1 Tax=Wolbachia endosymbiont (group E) of Neria commutata TaxID=3066149 RepID=UPI003132F341
MKKFLLLIVLIIFFPFDANATKFSNKKDDEFYNSKVTDHPSWFMCSIMKYLHRIGGPIMTLVITGAALLAIFGRMPWPALFALGMFTAVFFGAQAIILYVAPPDTHDCRTDDWQPSGVPLGPRLMGKKLSSMNTYGWFDWLKFW